MQGRPTAKPLGEWVAETEDDMRQLGYDPSSPEDWRRYAIVRFREHRLITGIEKVGDTEIIEVDKRAHDAAREHATLARMLAIELRGIDQDHRKSKGPSQRDVLGSAVRSLEAISDLFAPLKISPFGGLPTPLEILIPELLNVLEGRLSRLLTPADSVVAAAREVRDSNKDLIRITVKAYAAAAVLRLIESKQCPTQNEAYRRVANVVTDAGFYPPGKRKTDPYKPSTIRAWYEKASTEPGALHQRYQQAVEVTPEDPDTALDLLTTHIRLFQFVRENGAA